MYGTRNGGVSLLQDSVDRKIVTHHCIIHQQAFCSRVLKFDHVMSVVVLMTNYNRKLK